MSFKLGRKAPSNTPAIRFGAILKQGVQIPPHPINVDYLARLTSWQVLGNDTYGDCVAVTWANERRVLTKGASYPNLNEVIQLYKTQNPKFPAQDNGMDIQQALSYLTKTGGPDGVKAVAFAKVDYTNLEEVKAAIAIFGVVWVGVNVQNSQMNQFDAGKPWDWIAGEQPEGGHSIVAGGYNGTAIDDVKFITWGTETAFTDNFWNHGVEEAWVVIWPEHWNTDQFTAGIDATALAAFYHDLTGNTLQPPVPPVPVPPVVPTPSPSPQPVVLADQALELAYGKLSRSSRASKAGKLIAQWILDKHFST